MSYTIFNSIATAFRSLFGGSMMLPFLIIAVIAILLLSLRVGKIVFFIVLIPLLTTIVTFGVSSFFEGMGVQTQWIAVAGWLAAGFIAAVIFWTMQQ